MSLQGLVFVLLKSVLHHWSFGFVQSLFNLHGSTGQSLRTPTLRVVPGLTAVADRAASRLPRSRLTILSIRHSGSLVRAGARVFGNSDPTGCCSSRLQRIRGKCRILGGRRLSKSARSPLITMLVLLSRSLASPKSCSGIGSSDRSWRSRSGIQVRSRLRNRPATHARSLPYASGSRSGRSGSVASL